MWKRSNIAHRTPDPLRPQLQLRRGIVPCDVLHLDETKAPLGVGQGGRVQRHSIPGVAASSGSRGRWSRGYQCQRRGPGRLIPGMKTRTGSLGIGAFPGYLDRPARQEDTRRTRCPGGWSSEKGGSSEREIKGGCGKHIALIEKLVGARRKLPPLGRWCDMSYEQSGIHWAVSVAQYGQLPLGQCASSPVYRYGMHPVVTGGTDSMPLGV